MRVPPRIARDVLQRLTSPHPGDGDVWRSHHPLPCALPRRWHFISILHLVLVKGLGNEHRNPFFSPEGPLFSPLAPADRAVMASLFMSCSQGPDFLRGTHSEEGFCCLYTIFLRNEIRRQCLVRRVFLPPEEQTPVSLQQPREHHAQPVVGVCWRLGVSESRPPELLGKWKCARVASVWLLAAELMVLGSVLA